METGLADTLTDIEKLVRRYPNHFEIIYYSARVYWTAGTVQRNREWLKRALDLLRHTVLLVDQNTDEKSRLPPASACRKSLFAPLRQFFELWKSSKNWLIEREGGSLPPSLFPCCSIIQLLFMVF